MNDELCLPEAYEPRLDVRERERAIKVIKDFFETNLARALGLARVSAPLFVRAGTGINDDLNGVERPVSFRVRGDGDAEAEMVQSLAKWKRLALSQYGFGVGEGLYTDMNAVRPDEVLDNLHSIYVDQWDWEKVIAPAERNLSTLQQAVQSVYDVLCRTEFHVASLYSNIRPRLPAEITFVTTEDLVACYPDLAPAEREDRVCSEHRAVFLVGVGGDLPDGRPHDGRAPDYDDWTTLRPDGGRGLNGDILLWNDVLERAFEISSMGIRVDPETLQRQLAIRGVENWKDRPFISKCSVRNCRRPWVAGSGSRACACSSCDRLISVRWPWDSGLGRCDEPVNEQEWSCCVK